ncbi:MULTISPECIES: alpha-amylase family glycosyl hydrolase [unclassified Caulobacter]|uniref:alpha-amylase family glycosyl hydrolase n=1 Tax=unclassified Caulobacter TaxID=2648921 RepID=UPI000D3710BD|nr:MULTISPECIES: alpha-amylase family glycosyl hydrolase [unclassified Caulobacter]PTS88683.1 alpha-glucosidase [Caulobacter sp. HMWF009]PTT05185.1 alpha-glucosidase [Caulobacter sp. HMWF025]
MRFRGATVTVKVLSRPAVESQAESEWWRGAVIYQVYPRSFADSNGDGVGDLPGITARLEHIASLGVDAIWLSPFYKSPMKDFGYDVSDYLDVDPIFGTLADFDQLIAKAHGLGVKVIIDQVFSHTSDEHPWFEASRQDRTNPHADWYVWADAKPDGSPPSNWQSVFGGPAWTWDARRGQYYMHNFLASQPQLNVHAPAVQDALLATARFWIDRGVEGFRFDAINFSMHDPALTDNPPLPPGGKRTRPFDFQDKIHNQSHADIPKFLSRLRALTDAHGGRFSVAEVGGDHADREMKLFTAGEDRLNSAYGFLYLYAEHLTGEMVRQGQAMWAGADGEGWPSWTFSNHDAPRAVSRWAEGRDRKAFAEMALLLLVALRGNVFVYQGEELGLPQANVPFERLQDPEAIANWPQTLGRDGARTPMPWVANAPQAGFSPVEPWLPVDPAHLPLAVDAQEADPASTLLVARRLIGLRRRFPVLRTGDVTFVDSNTPLLIFERGEGSEALLFAFNLGHEAVAWALPDGWTLAESVNLADDGVVPPCGGLMARKI